MVSALDSGSDGLSSSPGRGTALCSWARHFTLTQPRSRTVGTRLTLTVPLSTQVYKWVPAK